MNYDFLVDAVYVNTERRRSLLHATRVHLSHVAASFVKGDNDVDAANKLAAASESLATLDCWLHEITFNVTGLAERVEAEFEAEAEARADRNHP